MEVKQDVELLNESLHILVDIFPRISPEVFRELLSIFEGESGLLIAIDQLLRHPERWIRARWRSATDTDHTHAAAKYEFRSPTYKQAVYRVLRDEFDILSRSTVNAVLAEENHCYGTSRIALQKLVQNKWRSKVGSFGTNLRKSIGETQPHFMITWSKDESNNHRRAPILKETYDPQLDEELQSEVLNPLLEAMRKEQEVQDLRTAVSLNESEAKAVGALYECQCCFSCVTFELLGVCSTELHPFCYQCISRATAEATFGQAWQKMVDNQHGTLRCFAPSSNEPCHGHFTQYTMDRAIKYCEGSIDLRYHFDARLGQEVLAKTDLSYVHCPFCPYTEVDDPNIDLSIRGLSLISTNSNFWFRLITATLVLAPVMVVYYVIRRFSILHVIPSPKHMANESHARLFRMKAPQQFRCKSPSCALHSCLRCSKVWRDPHYCHERQMVSLQAVIEAARTAAFKRTCPRCNIAFVKDSGCNRLTCVCGYSMCYICRQGLDRIEGGASYRHFCQHFRPQGGNCRKCSKCDLYKDPNDDDAILKAGIMAEVAWRRNEGLIAIATFGQGDSQYRTMQERFTNWWVAGLTMIDTIGLL